MGQKQELPSIRNHYNDGVELLHLSQCNEEGTAVGLESPGPSAFSLVKWGDQTTHSHWSGSKMTDDGTAHREIRIFFDAFFLITKPINMIDRHETVLSVPVPLFDVF